MEQVHDEELDEELDDEIQIMELQIKSLRVKDYKTVVKSAKNIKFKSRQEKIRSIHIHLELLKHSVLCNTFCQSDNCKSMKLYLKHINECYATKREKTCETCNRVNTMLKCHSKTCIKNNCIVPKCKNNIITL